MAAWSRIPDPSKPTRTFIPYNCDDCIGDPGRRAGLRCSRFDLEPVKWDPDTPRVMQRMRHHQGRTPLPDYNGKPYNGIGIDFRYPPEDPDEGCPAGWVYSAYLYSLAPYFRQRTEGGGRVENPMFSRCDDPRVLAAIRYFESEQERSVYYVAETAYEYLDQKNKG